MPLWGSVDNAANSAYQALLQVNKSPTSANRTELYANTTQDVYFTGVAVGQFGVSAAEQQAVQGPNHTAHAGWVLRTVGTGPVSTLTIAGAGTGVNAGGYLSFSGGGGSGANASYSIANSQNTLEAYSTNPVWNVVSSVTLNSGGSGYTSTPTVAAVTGITNATFAAAVGGRAGRVQSETLVAGGSITGDGSDDSIFPDYRIVITTQPQDSEESTGNQVFFYVTAATVPTGGTIYYQWQQSGANISDGGVYANSQTAILDISDNTDLDGNTFGVVLYVTGANTVVSANATLTEV